MPVEDSFGTSCDELMAKLDERGIETRRFFVPMHRQPVFEGVFDAEAYPVADERAEIGLYLPSSSDLSEDGIQSIYEAIRDISRAVAVKPRRSPFFRSIRISRRYR